MCVGRWRRQRMGRDYLALDAERIVRTVKRLAARVNERFPDSGLSQVALQLTDVAGKAKSEALNG